MLSVNPTVEGTNEKVNVSDRMNADVWHFDFSMDDEESPKIYICDSWKIEWKTEKSVSLY